MSVTFDTSQAPGTTTSAQPFRAPSGNFEPSATDDSRSDGDARSILVRTTSANRSTQPSMDPAAVVLKPISLSTNTPAASAAQQIAQVYDFQTRPTHSYLMSSAPADPLVDYVMQDQKDCEASRAKVKVAVRETSRKILEELKPGADGKSLTDQIIARLIKQGKISAGEVDKVQIIAVGCFKGPQQSLAEGSPLSDHYYQVTLPDGQREFFGKSAIFPLLVKVEPRQLPRDPIVYFDQNQAGQWNPHFSLSGQTSRELASREQTREQLHQFAREGNDEVRGLEASKTQVGFPQYLDKLQSLPPEIKQNLEREREILANSQPKTIEEIVRNQALLKSYDQVLAGNEHNAALREHYQSILDAKSLAHANKDWDMASFKQVPATYIDSVTGQKRELTLFEGKTKSGATVILDLFDGAVYEQRENSSLASGARPDPATHTAEGAMEDFLASNRYGKGFVKYSLDSGKTVETRAAWDKNDPLWAALEKAGAYAGYASIGLMLSPDPLSKVPAAISGTVSMAIGAASSLRHLANDLSHEREVDPLDVLNLAAVALDKTGMATKGLSPLTRAIRASAIATSLGCDVAQGAIGIKRLYSELDLGNPALGSEERMRRLHVFIEQAALNFGMTALSVHNNVLNLSRTNTGHSTQATPRNGTINTLPEPVTARGLHESEKKIADIIRGETPDLAIPEIDLSSKEIELLSRCREEYGRAATSADGKKITIQLNEQNSQVLVELKQKLARAYEDKFAAQDAEFARTTASSNVNETPSPARTFESWEKCEGMNPQNTMNPDQPISFTREMFRDLKEFGCLNGEPCSYEEFVHTFVEPGHFKLPTAAEWNRCPGNQARAGLMADHFGEGYSRYVAAAPTISPYHDNPNDFIRVTVRGEAELRKIDTEVERASTSYETVEGPNAEIDDFARDLPTEVSSKIQAHIFRKGDGFLDIRRIVDSGGIDPRRPFYETSLNPDSFLYNRIAGLDGAQIMAVGNARTPVSDLKYFVISSEYAKQLPKLQRLFPEAKFIVAGDTEAMTRFANCEF